MTEELMQKAFGAPILMRVVVDAVKEDFPQDLLASYWSNFRETAIIAGCVALVLRLHSDVPQESRAFLEFTIHQVLRAYSPSAERHYNDCDQYVMNGLLAIQSARRHEAIFPLAASWVCNKVFGTGVTDEFAGITSRLAEFYESGTNGYWLSSDLPAPPSVEAKEDQGNPAMEIGTAALGSVGCLGMIGLNMVFSVIPVVIGLFVWVWLAQSFSSGK